MSISCQSLYEDITQQLGLGTGNTKLANSFVRAVNRALDQMSVSSDLTTKHAHISNQNSTITTLISAYEYMLYAGVYYWLVRMGHSASDPRIASVMYRDSAEAWTNALADYKQDADNLVQADSTQDVIGLGSPENY